VARCDQTRRKEEVEYDKGRDPEQYATLEEGNNRRKAKPGPLRQSEIDFVKLSEDNLEAMNEYEMKYDKDGNSLKWKILQDTEYLKQDDDRMKYPDGPTLLREIDFGSGDKSLADIFFDEFFPSIVGHALLMDKYLSDIRAGYHTTVMNKKIQFSDPSDDDPDWIVKQCYILLIAAAWEGDTGIENLWKRGKSGGRHNYEDFGQQSCTTECLPSVAVLCGVYVLRQ
jgi:hypothetical protein